MTAGLVRARRCFLVAAATAFLLPSLSVAPAQTTRPLTIAIASDFVSLDPDKYVTWNDHWIYGNLFEGLYEPDFSGKLVPGLAERCDIEAGGLAYACTLRAGALWHNGDPVTTDDVLFSWSRSIGPELHYQRAGMLTQNITGIERVDDRRFIVRLRNPDAMTMEKLSLYWQVKPKKYIEAVGNDEFARKPVGSGRFQFVERRANEFVRIRAFDQHWAGPPKAAEIVIKIVPEEQSRITQVMSGEADVATPLSPVLAARLKSMPNLAIVEVPAFQNVQIKFNTNQPETAKKLVRQALTMAIDRDQIEKTLMIGYARRQEMWCTSGQIGCDPSAVQPYPFDPARARQMLEEAKFDFNTPLRFVGLASGRVPQSKETVELIAQYLQKIGVKTTLDIMEFGTWARVHAAPDKDKTIALFFTTQPDPYTDMSYRLDITTRIGAAGTWANDQQVDEMVSRVNTVTDATERERLMTKILARIHDEALYMPLWSLPNLYLTTKGVDFKVPPYIAYGALWEVTKR